jgi:hypothetical protein
MIEDLIPAVEVPYCSWEETLDVLIDVFGDEL